MYLLKEKIPLVLNDYLQKIMIPKSPTSFQTFISSVTVGFGIKKINSILTDPKMVATLTTVGALDNLGRIDLETMKKVLEDAIKISGVINIPIIDYNVDSSDIQSIFDIAKQYSVGETNGNNVNVPTNTF